MLKNLNNFQKEIVLTKHKKVYVNAGAGTGKTTLIVARVCYLIKQGVLPDNILVVAFNKKIVEEVNAKLYKTLGFDIANKITIKTFHSFGSWIIRKAQKYINPIISDDKELSKIVTKARSHLQLKGSNKELLPIIQACRENPKYLSQQTNDIKMLCKSYGTVLKKEKRSDFAILIRKANMLLKKNKEFKDTIQNKFKYIFVDEFQDCSERRFKLLKQLTTDKTSLFLVGDTDQTILEWAGVSIDNVMCLSQTFSDLKHYTLEQSYRLPKTICKASNSLISKNKKRLDKTLKTIKRGGLLEVKKFLKFEDEVNWCCNYVNTIIQDGVFPREIAILARKESVLFDIKNILGKTGIHISTIHKAKGLEFDNVVILGVENSIIPDNKDNLEEERRILYVGMTRAKKSLILTYIDKGIRNMGFVKQYVEKSPFIAEMNLSV